MDNYICVTCGVQFPESHTPPEHCPICEDERQYVGWKGQQWTTPAELQETHQNEFRDEEPGLISVGTEPKFAIGQRAYLIQTGEGIVLWDCLSLLDEATIDSIRWMGGLTAIAISHPHFYSSMVEWSRVFGDIPIYLQALDHQWVMRPDPAIVAWNGPTQALPGGLTLIHCGGHFAGATALHWPAGDEGRGVLFTSDTISVAEDRRFVSFMRSYPNLIPLAAPPVHQIVRAIQPFSFNRIYGAWTDMVVSTDAKDAVVRSAERYVKAIRSV